MKLVEIFKFEQNEVRTLLINDEPFFVGKDVAEVLGYSETNAMTKRLDKEDFISDKLEGMNMKSTLINESGLYTAIIGSQLPNAKKFKRWVTSDVLPTIRKHGMYAKEELLDNPDLLIEVASKLKEERTLRLVAEQKVNELQPKVLFTEAVQGSKNSCLVKDLSVLLKQNGVDIGQNRLFAYLRENGYLGKGNGHLNKPTQRSLDQKLFEYREHFHTNGNGEVETKFTPKVTGKGQVYFVNKFLKNDIA